MTQFTFARRTFVIRFWPALICALVIAVTIAAAQWQTARAHYKQGLLAAYELAQSAPALDVTQWGPVAPAEYSNATIEGVWKASVLIYADNRVRNGQVGYGVFMPLCQTSVRCVLVDRGWVRSGRLREDLPAVPTEPGVQRIEGVVLRAESRFVELSADSVEGKVWQNVTVDRVARASSLELAPFIFAQHGGPEDGLTRERLKPEFGIDKHIAYAGQWYAFALVTALSGLFAAMKKTGEKS
ncbi:SURF1 family protein [Methyloversatilis sp. RAC08]|uniref:SURF1 family protein n=1 Tax=Methyloversatilis sp. RAC08 TaxID=1842540 RepID=UPI00083E601B|nr:SURF1 family protein [Methyloversatilis sp. RAC08]AOF82436.1 SURF1 family protein [Methyloversatilis sp. RAC08]